MLDRSTRFALVTLAALAAFAAGCSSAPPAPMADADVETCTDDVVDGGECRYAGPGSTCSVACAMPAGCVYRLSIHWSEPYCCGFPNESFESCVCEGGQTLCGDPLRPPGRRLPSTACSCGTDAAAP
jgi:hypothetical protein